MSLRSVPLAAASCLAWFAATANAQDDVQLRYRFEAGGRESYRLTQDADMELAINIPGFDRRQKAAFRNILEWTARTTKVEDSVGHMALRVDRLAFEGSLGDEKVRFDSADTDEKSRLAGLISAGINKLLGRDFDVEVSARGELRKAEGLKKLLEEAGRELGLPLGADVAAKLDEPVIAGLFVRQAWPSLPEERLKVGSNWRQTLVAASDGAAVVEAEYVVKAFENVDGRRVARISVNVKPDEAALKKARLTLPLPKLQGLEAGLGLRKWESDGELLFLVKEGRLLRSKVDTRLEFSVSAQVAGNAIGFEVKYDGRDRVEKTDKP